MSETKPTIDGPLTLRVGDLAYYDSFMSPEDPN